MHSPPPSPTSRVSPPREAAAEGGPTSTPSRKGRRSASTAAPPGQRRRPCDRSIGSRVAGRRPKRCRGNLGEARRSCANARQEPPARPTGAATRSRPQNLCILPPERTRCGEGRTESARCRRRALGPANRQRVSADEYAFKRRRVLEPAKPRLRAVQTNARRSRAASAAGSLASLFGANHLVTALVTPEADGVLLVAPSAIGGAVGAAGSRARARHEV